MVAVKICEKCGESSGEHAIRCSVCGSSLSQAQTVGTRKEDKEEILKSSEKPRLCTGCGEQLAPETRKCKYCGTLVTKPQVTAIQSAMPFEQEIFKLGRLGVLLLGLATILFPPAGLVIGGVALFSDHPDKQDSGKVLMIFGIVVGVIEFLIYRYF